MNGRIPQRADANGNIGAFLQQIDDQVIGIQFQLNLRVALAKARHQRHNHVFHKGGGGIDPQPAGRDQPAQRHLLFSILHRVDNFTRMAKKTLAFFGQLQPARGAAHQGRIELFFQPTEGTADAGGGLAKLFGGGSNGTAINNGGKRQ
ncbi:hypothetical protein D3C73_936930 [compost metagenome]